MAKIFEAAHRKLGTLDSWKINGYVEVHLNPRIKIQYVAAQQSTYRRSFISFVLILFFLHVHLVIMTVTYLCSRVKAQYL